MSDMNFICPTCKRPTQQADNEIIEHFAKEKDRYVGVLGERTKELYRTRKALELIRKEMTNEYMPDFAVIRDALKTALEQKDV